MKVGDLVLKNRGNDSGETGIIINVSTNSYAGKNAVTILEVMVGEVVKNWYSDYVEVLHENR